MWLSVTPTRQFTSIPHNVTQLSGTVPGELLGLEDDLAEELISVTVELPLDWNMTHCSELTGCESVKMVICVHFYAQTSMFPLSRYPHTCQALNETGIEWHRQMIAHNMTILSSILT